MPLIFSIRTVIDCLPFIIILSNEKKKYQLLELILLS